MLLDLEQIEELDFIQNLIQKQLKKNTHNTQTNRNINSGTFFHLIICINFKS